MVVKSKIKHEKEGMGRFVRAHFGKRMGSGNYSGMLIYANLYGDMDLVRRDGE